MEEERFQFFSLDSSISICSCLHSTLQNGVSPLQETNMERTHIRHTTFISSIQYDSQREKSGHIVTFGVFFFLGINLYSYTERKSLFLGLDEKIKKEISLKQDDGSHRNKSRVFANEVEKLNHKKILKKRIHNRQISPVLSSPTSPTPISTGRKLFPVKSLITSAQQTRRQQRRRKRKR